MSHQNAVQRGWQRLTPWALVLLALGWRLWLMPQYYGWEESDYGNLAMAHGVLESGFTEFDMRHLPLYYFLSALVLALVGDSVVATHTVSLVAGVGCVLLLWHLGVRAFNLSAGSLAGLLACFQPELALYSASSLREPLYTVLVLGGCLALMRGAFGVAAGFSGLSFLTRFDSLVNVMPAVVWFSLRRGGSLRRLSHPIWRVLGIFLLCIGSWSLYCGMHHGTYLFFMPTVQVNLDTGGVQERIPAAQWLIQAGEVALALFFQTLPRHLGRALWIYALLGLWLFRRELLSRGARSVLLLYLLLLTGFWMMIGVVGQHEPGHNLYWKWLYPLAPFWIILASAAAVRLGESLGPGWPRWIPGALLLALSGAAFAKETRHQLEQSARLYKPQLEVAQWVEAHVPPGTRMIFDNIPACYLNRRTHRYQLVSWFDLPVEQGNPASLAEYLSLQQVRYVLWFKEEWTQAPSVAPYLEKPQPHRLGPLVLEPLFQESEYGFIFYAVRNLSESGSDAGRN